MTAAPLQANTSKRMPDRALWFASAILIVLIGTACSQDTKPNKGKMNISLFGYRDINRNGSYDISDRPYAGLQVSLQHPDGERSRTRSNIGGFANFAMSLSNDAYDITAAGRYQVAVTPIEGWQVTSGAAAQELIIKELEGSPGGLIAEQTLVPVDVAPELTISGTLDLPATVDASVYFVSAVSQTGHTLEATVSTQGAYSIAAQNGVWRLEFHGPDGLLATRVATVSNYPVIASAVSPGRQPPVEYEQTKRIGFDDLTHSDTLYEIPNGYAGLGWRNWIATHQKFYHGAGYINAAVSGEYVAYNSSGHPATIESSDAFDFISAYIAVAWPQAERGYVAIKGWRDDELVYQDRIRASTSGPIQFAADYNNVTRVEFSTEHYWQVLLDDIEVSTVSRKP